MQSRQADIVLTADAPSIRALEKVAEVPYDCVCIGTPQWLPKGATHIDVEDLAGKPFLLPTGACQRSRA